MNLTVKETDTVLTAKPSWGSRILGMEGLRGLAALTVLAGHTRTHLAADLDLGFSGKVLGLFLEGLLLFFALSGFLLYRPFAAGILNRNRYPATLRFLANRVIRIYPAYLAVFLLVSLALGLAYTRPFVKGMSMTDTSEIVGHLNDLPLIVANGFLVQTYFPFSMKTGLGVAWSLTVEIAFYLLLPLLAFLALKLAKRVSPRLAILIPPLILLFIGVASKVVLVMTTASATAEDQFYLEWGSNWHAVFARSILTHADYFAFGMFAAILIILAESRLLSPRSIQRWRWFSLGGGLSIAALFAALNLDPWTDTAYALLFGCVIAFIALPGNTDGEPGIVARFLESKPFRYLGLLSYSMYLWHLPVLWGLNRYGLIAEQTPMGLLINFLVVFLVTSLLSSGTYFLVEKPALGFKLRTDRSSSQRTTYTSGALQ